MREARYMRLISWTLRSGSEHVYIAKCLFLKYIKGLLKERNQGLHKGFQREVVVAVYRVNQAILAWSY